MIQRLHTVRLVHYSERFPISISFRRLPKQSVPSSQHSPLFNARPTIPRLRRPARHRISKRVQPIILTLDDAHRGTSISVTLSRRRHRLCWVPIARDEPSTVIAGTHGYVTPFSGTADWPLSTPTFGFGAGTGDGGDAVPASCGVVVAGDRSPFQSALNGPVDGGGSEGTSAHHH